MEITKARKKYIYLNGMVLEWSLDAFGIKAKVKEACTSNAYTDFDLALGAGTNLEKLEKLTKEMALAVASPTGQVSWIKLDPTKSIATLRVPNLTDDQIEIMEKKETARSSFKQKLSDFFLVAKAILLFPLLIFGKGKKNNLHNYCRLIEETLSDEGVCIHIKEVNINERDYEFLCEVAVGTRVSILEKASGKLAKALSSPTGRVFWRIPVPGKSLVGLKLPKSPAS